MKKMMLKAYGGLSSSLVLGLLAIAGISPEQSTEALTPEHWQRLFTAWQSWLQQLEAQDFRPGWTEGGYTVLGWGVVTPATDLQELINDYYRQQLNQQTFSRLQNQLTQKLKGVLKKLRQKANTFQTRLNQSEQADEYRQRADLLMAYSHQWQPGMDSITLADFETGKPVKIPLNPDRNGVQNAQALYKQHQKLKRARHAVQPLLAEVQAEINYLEQVEAALQHTSVYRQPADLEAISDIRDELIQQGYLVDPTYRPAARADHRSPFRRARTPDGLPIIIGRNNRQNDLLISTTATDYDLWFHTQEIPGSHVLLRLEPGQVPSDGDIQYTANVAAFFSRARQAEQVPVVYTQPRHVYKPKGARPGMVIYTHETVVWGQPQQVTDLAQPQSVAP